MKKYPVKIENKEIGDTPIFIIKHCQKLCYPCLFLISILVLYNPTNNFLIKVVGVISIIIVAGSVGGSALVNLIFNWWKKS